MNKPAAAAQRELKRVTTEYIPQEDRIRISGEEEGGGKQTFLLTQRLLNRMLPVFLQRLAGKDADMPRAETLQSFAQQVARAEQTPQSPVRVAAGTEWLVQSVDVAQAQRGVILTFKGFERQHATMILADKLLRSWLNILYDTYRKAEWPLDVWPEWMRESTLSATPKTTVLH